MSFKHLHILAFDVPYPADYGGVIDIYYKVKSLHQQGVKVHLHCFEYARKQAKELELICESVQYYQRNMSKRFLLDPLPFIVVSRQSDDLINNLIKDQHPILFEGLHTCYYLNDERLKNRIKIVRTHNIEHDYYAALSHNEKHIFRKIYFKHEAEKLKQIEPILQQADTILAISKADAKKLSEHFSEVHFIGAFHPYQQVSSLSGTGKYCLYHGNLSVAENNRAALYLIKEVFSKINTPCVIAGKNPSKEIQKNIATFTHIRLIKNPDQETMQELIQNAQINILPAFQTTGIKLKLLSALFHGRHCITNKTMIEHTGLEELCTSAESPQQMIAKINLLFQTPFHTEEKEHRNKLLLKDFSNEENVKTIIRFL